MTRVPLPARTQGSSRRSPPADGGACAGLISALIGDHGQSRPRSIRPPAGRPSHQRSVDPSQAADPAAPTRHTHRRRARAPGTLSNRDTSQTPSSGMARRTARTGRRDRVGDARGHLRHGCLAGNGGYEPVASSQSCHSFAVPQFRAILMALCLGVLGAAAAPRHRTGRHGRGPCRGPRRRQALETQAEAAYQTFQTTSARLEEVQRPIRVLRDQLTAQTAAVEAARAALGRAARNSYMAGGVDAGLYLLLSDDGARIRRCPGRPAARGRLKARRPGGHPRVWRPGCATPPDRPHSSRPSPST